MFEKDVIRADAARFKCSPRISFKVAMERLQTDESFRNHFIEQLKNGTDFKAYFFETPPVTCETMDKTDFEFVLVKSKDLEDILLKQEAFQKYFQEGRNDIAVFDNLGKDAKLVVPCPRRDTAPEVYTHLASFVRGAIQTQVHDFLFEVGSSMVRKTLDRSRRNKPVFLSTAGLGTYWLHMRLDDRPKYYKHLPYKHAFKD